MVPVARDDHPSAIKFQPVKQGALPIQAAETMESMGLGIILLHNKTLSDAQILLTASSKQHLARLKRQGDAHVMGVGHVKYLPLVTVEEFCCRCGQET